MKPEYPIKAPKFGEAVEITPQIFWARIPLPMALDHLNAYWFVDDDGVTIVDTGLKTETTKAIWRDINERYIAPLPIKRILVTHYHPDHAGLAAWLAQEHDAELIMSRTSYLLLRMLLLDVQEQYTELHQRYWQRVGYDDAWIANRMTMRPFNMIDSVEMIAPGYRSLAEGEMITLGGCEWRVAFGQGHAPDHLTLWHKDFVLIGDQCLPAITPVISVFPAEPVADPLAEFTEACAKLAGLADDEQLFLCGHNRPFYGGKSRLLHLASHHDETLNALRAALKTPKTMIDCYPLLFVRKITDQNEGFAMSEATAHFNHLERLGEIEAFTDQDGRIRWKLRQGVA